MAGHQCDAVTVLLTCYDAARGDVADMAPVGQVVRRKSRWSDWGYHIFAMLLS